ncbi:hypothetical protein EOD29_22840 [Mesorhizobium sp. M1A.T.Ca.IN.004.03.1.1]|uniref:hypothetical protein n=1 Tax=Mesorhizobium sp. M1A.T.Ca.IN.004.03.1.1 TaxID=2496795 RepID=UPI000FCA5E2E|nr:hypothetical protein [Mesorhizobium sp. M1A.T.Ca.IN.004.03.1.1]RUV41395.1 hypothetical protein EOD29_22840 [Mesorhizobium sp. M1A.T.Ca.IN.004.03.1.1]
MQTDLEPNEIIRQAAEFIASPREHSGRATIPEVRERCGLTTPQAIEALRLANALRLARAC